ncbi:unnamed protein product, partial [Mesorhabditis spiculigera]
MIFGTNRKWWYSDGLPDEFQKHCENFVNELKEPLAWRRLRYSGQFSDVETGSAQKGTHYERYCRCYTGVIKMDWRDKEGWYITSDWVDRDPGRPELMYEAPQKAVMEWFVMMQNDGILAYVHTTRGQRFSRMQSRGESAPNYAYPDWDNGIDYPLFTKRLKPKDKKTKKHTVCFNFGIRKRLDGRFSWFGTHDLETHGQYIPVKFAPARFFSFQGKFDDLDNSKAMVAYFRQGTYPNRAMEWMAYWWDSAKTRTAMTEWIRDWVADHMLPSGYEPAWPLEDWRRKKIAVSNETL